MRARSMVATLAVPLLVLAGCGGSPEEEIAADACDLLQQVVDEGPEALMGGEYMQQFQELEERAAEEDISDQEMEQAMREQCPETFDELEDMFLQDMEVEPGDPDDGELEDDLDEDLDEDE
jgi:hypothetical protein